MLTHLYRTQLLIIYLTLTNLGDWFYARVAGTYLILDNEREYRKIFLQLRVALMFINVYREPWEAEGQ
jgi:hypothetical protein